MGISYTDKEKAALQAAKKNLDRNAGNKDIVLIVARKMGISDDQLFKIHLPTDEQGASHETEAGTFKMRRVGRQGTDNVMHLSCADKCGLGFTYLPVDGYAYGYFTGPQHSHLPHLIPALVETSQLLALMHTEGDEEGARPFHEAFHKIQRLLGAGGALAGKTGIYGVFFVPSKEQFESLSLEERFAALRYTGQTTQEIKERFQRHTANLHTFTASGPKFVVVCGAQDMRGDEATYWETRFITLAASHHAIINCDRPGPWKLLPDVTHEEDFMATAMKMLEFLTSGSVTEFDWSDKLAKKPSPFALPESAHSDESPSPSLPGRKRKRPSASTTPTSALNQMTLSFTFDGTLEDFDKRRAEHEAELDKRREELERRREEESAPKEDPSPSEQLRLLSCIGREGRPPYYLSYPRTSTLGYLVGCLLGGFISDRYGRKPAIFGFSILSTIFGFLLAFSKEFEVFLVVRFLLAVCNEAADLAAYVYCMEITGVQYRSIVGSLLQAPWACGYAFLALVAYLCKSWKTIQLITTFLHFLSLFLIHKLPESPRWLIVMNRVDEAERIIRKACHFNNSSLPSDLGLVRHAEMRKWVKHNERPHFLHSFKSKAMTIRNIIVFIVWIATALVYYGCVIALSDQSSPGRSMFVGNFFLNNAIAGAIEMPTLMCCVLLLQFGRKRSQVITLISAGILIFIAMCASLVEEMTFSLLFMLAGKACIQASFNILYIFTSELYPTVIRNTAVGTCSMVARIGAGASGYIAILSEVTLPTVPMAIFCIFSLFAGVLIYFLPETRDCPLPDTMWDAVTMLKNNSNYKCAGGIAEDVTEEDEINRSDDSDEGDDEMAPVCASKR